MPLTSLRVKDFKRVNDVHLDLADVNILVGGNASGKSSIIQAVHLGCCVLRQADRIQKDKASTIGIEELDYLPSNAYKMLGHKVPWGNNFKSPSSSIELTFDEGGTINSATCELRSARNAGLSVSGTVPSTLTNLLRKKDKFFSAYMPGISGIPNREEKKSKKVILKACSFGDSNVVLRNVLLLLKQSDNSNLPTIESWLSKIIGPVKIHVAHEDARDLVISCEVTIEGDTRPLELIGTGYLQLMQVFAYVLLFNPGIVLIDEPDIHLHPTVQERLVQVLAQIAEERKVRVLLTTHSPFILRGAPPNAKVYWIKDGVIESEKRAEIELLLGWGIFGKKVILYSEDSNRAFLTKLIEQWPEIARQVAVLPGTGYNHIITPVQARQLSEAFGGKVKVLVHRDRDSLTDDEVKVLSGRYQKEGVTLWLTDMSDLEAYFCEPSLISAIAACTPAEAAQYVSDILSRKSKEILSQFESQRKAHNEELHAQGGSPTNTDVWNAFQSRALQGAKGKYVFNQLKDIIPKGVFREDRVFLLPLPSELAPRLKSALENLL